MLDSPWPYLRAAGQADVHRSFNVPCNCPYLVGMQMPAGRAEHRQQRRSSEHSPKHNSAYVSCMCAASRSTGTPASMQAWNMAATVDVRGRRRKVERRLLRMLGSSRRDGTCEGRLRWHPLS